MYFRKNMFLNRSLQYIISVRIQFFISIVLGGLVLFILFFLEPFGTGNADFPLKGLYLAVFGLITSMAYLLTHFLSGIYYRKNNVWKFLEEILFLIVFILIAIVVAFFYLELVINKNPQRLNLAHFSFWFGTMFLGFGTLLFASAHLLRRYYSSINLLDEEKKEERLINDEKITISGNLKKDKLTVFETSLVYLKSENNYIRIYYYEETILKNKLLRGTLFGIKKQLPSFIQIHRSYIVNPTYILYSKGNKQNAKLYLKEIEHSLPISASYFEKVNSIVKV